jgi:[Skp1-protein]-hydroxyproline N-acetylglucosaminyltransferase
MLSLKWILLLLVLGVLGFVGWKIYKYYHAKQKSKQVLQFCSGVGPTENIFVSIGSYRDSETANTIFDLFCTAQCPYRVFVGICDITTDRDVDLMKTLFELCRSKEEMFFTDNPNHFFRQNLRIYPMEAHRARGPMVTRSIIERSLYRNEKYFMCIDSHMKFAEHWDSKCIDQLTKCPSERPVLTMLPPNFEKKDRWKKFEKMSFGQVSTFLCIGDVSPAAFPLLESIHFALAHWEVPYDRHCKNVFQGEAITMSARLWTAGWDFFCPLMPMCAHMYDRSYRPTYWELGKSPQRGEKRLQVLLNIRPSNTIHERVLKELYEIYGLGNFRTLEQYEYFCDIEFSKQRINDRALLGMLPVDEQRGPNQHEILCKYGSYGDLERRLNEVKHRNN